MSRPRTGSDLTITQLEELLEVRRTSLVKLDRERQKLLKRLEALDAEIAELGGDGRRGGSRVRNAMSLNETMVQVLTAQGGGPMKVADVADAVRATGYKTNSANFRGIVNQTLIKDKRFVSPVRGSYQLKKPPEKVAEKQ